MSAEGREWGDGSVVVGFCVFGAPRFSVKRSQNTCFNGFGDLWSEIRCAAKTRNPTAVDPTPHSQPSELARPRPSGPEETSWCHETNIAARRFLSLNCLTITHWNPKYGCRSTATACFALIALVAWKRWCDSTLRKLYVHPKYGWRNSMVSRVFPLIALIVLSTSFNSALGAAQLPSPRG